MCCAAAGKGKLAVEGEGGEGGERPCLEVLLGLPARPISRRSEGHLNQSLEVRVVCSACHWLAGKGGTTRRFLSGKQNSCNVPSVPRQQLTDSQSLTPQLIHPPTPPLQLLSSLLRPFEDEEVERLEKQRRQEEAERKQKAEEAAAAAAVPEQEGQQEGEAAMQTDQQQQQQAAAEQAVAAAAEASPGGSGTAQPLAAEPAVVAGAGDAAVSPAQQQAQPPASQRPAEGAAPAEAATSPAAAGGEDKAGPSSAPAAAAGADAAGAAGPSAAGASGSGSGEDAADKKRAAEEEALHRRYQAAFEALSLPLLRSLPRLLAEDWLADRPASVLKMVIQVGRAAASAGLFRLWRPVVLSSLPSQGSWLLKCGQHGNPASANSAQEPMLTACLPSLPRSRCRA